MTYHGNNRNMYRVFLCFPVPIPVKGAFALGEKSEKFHFPVPWHVGVAVCGSCVEGSCGVGELRCGGVKLWGGCVVRELRGI